MGPSMEAQIRPNTSPDLSFIITVCSYYLVHICRFSMPILKCTTKHLLAWLCSDPLGGAHRILSETSSLVLVPIIDETL